MRLCKRICRNLFTLGIFRARYLARFQSFKFQIFQAILSGLCNVSVRTNSTHVINSSAIKFFPRLFYRIFFIFFFFFSFLTSVVRSRMTTSRVRRRSSDSIRFDSIRFQRVLARIVEIGIYFKDERYAKDKRIRETSGSALQINFCIFSPCHPSHGYLKHRSPPLISTTIIFISNTFLASAPVIPRTYGLG